MAEGVHIYKLKTLPNVNIVESYRGFVTAGGLKQAEKVNSLMEEVVLELKKKTVALGANAVVGFEMQVLRSEGKVGKNLALSKAVNIIVSGTAIRI